MITRYSPTMRLAGGYHSAGMTHSAHGEFVNYMDHCAALQAQAREIEALRANEARLKELGAAMQDALKKRDAFHNAMARVMGATAEKSVSIPIHPGVSVEWC